MTKKNILVTGSDGFIGSHLVRCIEADYNVFEFNQSHGDIATSAINYKGIDHVIHLAGQTFVPKSWEDPYTFYRTNVLGTVNVLDFCRNNNASLTYISAYVYGIPISLPIREDHPLQPANPYMQSKIAAEGVCEFYAKNYGVRTTVLRPFNIYGPGQLDYFIIPKIVSQVLSKSDSVEVLSLHPKRDYLYIDDLTHAMKCIIELDIAFETVNIGSGVSYSVQEIIEFAMGVAGVNKTIHSEEKDRRNEIPDVVADISKAKELFGWEPKVDIQAGLKKTIDASR